MKVLLVGTGQIGLGLIAPIFTKAGYEVIGTDANLERLNDLQGGYILETPKLTSKIDLKVIPMNQVQDDFDLIITSVGRKNLEKVAAWYKEKSLAVPVMLAENLPDPITASFPVQIPIVVDRICPRIVKHNGLLRVTAEDYYRIIVLKNAFTERLETRYGIFDVEIETSMAELEKKRKKKLFTVNTSHIITALYGKLAGCGTIQEAIARKEIAENVKLIMSEIAAWLSMSELETLNRYQQIRNRFKSPINDKISRILGESSRRYLEIPLDSFRWFNVRAPNLEKAYKLLVS